MESGQDWIDDVFVADEGAPAVDEAATQAAAPEAESPPSTEPSFSHAADPDPLVAAAPDAEPGPPVEFEAEPEPGPPEIDWNHPELAAFKQQADAARQKAEQFDGLQQQLARIAEQKRAQDFQNRLRELAEDDPERLQHLNGLVAQVAAPAVQARDQAIQDRDRLGKAFSAFVVSAKAHLDESQMQTLMGEMEALMAVDDPHLMERAAFGKRDTVRLYEQKLADKDQQLRDLQRQLAARSEIAQRGPADLVDGGGGSSAGSDWTTRLDRAEDMDAYMDALFA